MLTRLIESKIAAQERWLGVDLDYMRYILRVSRPAFFKYIKMVPVANYRRALPPAPYHVAALLASIHEGCGNCVHIEIKLALGQGVSVGTLRAVVEQRPAELEEDVRDVYLFTRAVLDQSPQQAQLRRRIAERFGDAGLVELSMRIAVSRVFPVTTRALGFASSCAHIEVQPLSLV